MSFIFETAGALLGSQATAKAQKEQGRAEKDAAYLEAAQLEQVAKDTRAAATYNSERITAKKNEILAKQEAEMAARGSINDGSARAIRAKTIREASLDQVMLMADAETEAGKDEFQAKVARKTGDTAERLSKKRASATLLGGWMQAGASVAGGTYDMGWWGQPTEKKPS